MNQSSRGFRKNGENVTEKPVGNFIESYVTLNGQRREVEKNSGMRVNGLQPFNPCQLGDLSFGLTEEMRKWRTDYLKQQLAQCDGGDLRVGFWGMSEGC
jgi:hypothetical protein